MFDLTRELFMDITKMPCEYCGEAPSQIMSSKDANGVYVYNGIDRKDPLVGYTAENSVPCCGICNRAKSNMTFSKWMEWVGKLVKSQGRRES